MEKKLINIQNIQIKNIIRDFKSNKIKSVKQTTTNESYDPKPTDIDFQIDWKANINKIKNLIRACEIIGGAQSFLRNEQVLVSSILVLDITRNSPLRDGTVMKKLKSGFIIKCSSNHFVYLNWKNINKISMLLTSSLFKKDNVLSVNLKIISEGYSLYDT